VKNKFVFWKEKSILLASVFLFILSCQSIIAQSIFAIWGPVTQNLPFYKIQINSNAWCNSFCSQEFIGHNTTGTDGLTMSPEGDLYSIFGPTIFIIDTLTGMQQVFYDLPPWPDFPLHIGLVSTDGEIFYTISVYDWINGIPGDSLFRIDTNTGVITNLGYVGWEVGGGDITLLNGEFYFDCKISNPPLQSGIVKLDINNPSNNELVATFPVLWNIQGLTASTICNTLIASEFSNSQLVYVNIVDGAITPFCELTWEITDITSLMEFSSPTICELAIDLDCDDSSSATDADFNTTDFDCLSDGVDIADEDIGMMYDAYITTMTIELTGSLPDAPYEILEMTGSVTGIDVSGSGTDMITLTNEGVAKSTDFKDALRLIRYNNTALPPTAGVRTVEVQFTTESGSMSNVATAFIHVNELPLIPLDLGPDQEKCEGESATLDAGNPGSIYQWNTGAHTQSITVSNEGEYIVTIENGINCPNQDTVLLTILPIIHVSLTGNDEICDNEQANMTLTTDSPFPIDVVITPNPGSPFTLANVESSYDFFDLPSQSTEYTITNVIPSEPTCVEIQDPSQVIYVYPTYFATTAESICEGDSIWLGYYWETQAGTYEILFDTEYGCDSTVVYTIDILPAVNVTVQAKTCDPAEAGVFVTFINNPAGCDTIVHTTVSLLPSDTTAISQSSCNSASTGVFTQLLTNQGGCDSLVITTVSLIPPADTTSLLQTTCDSSQLGVFQQIVPDQAGCDSLIITTVTNAPADTSYLTSTSCDSSAIGVFELLLSNQSGCDSLVITTVSAGIPDTTYLFTTSCDSASLGVFETHFTSQSGCDSTVITTVDFSISDNTYITSSSCDSADVGVSTETFVNRFGCDSIVTTTVDYAMSHNIQLSASSCNPADVGVITETFINHYGCDSIVTTTVDLLPGDETFLFWTTCMSAETGVFVTSLVNQHGCDSIVTTTVSLVPADTTVISFLTCDPGQVGSIETSFTNQDGCDSFVIEQISLYPLPDLDIKVTSDFNGYDISCFGESDGSLSANVVGVPPYTYIWSTGSLDQSITGLLAGNYSVTVTDGNGCKTNVEVMIIDPPPFMISFTVSTPECFDQNNGSITVNQNGGVLPIRYSMDGVNYQSSSVFDSLAGGSYTVTALDANDCEDMEIILINAPLMVNVELGDNKMIMVGDTAVIHAIVNVPYDSLASVSWSGLLNPNCPTCLTQLVAPIITTTYSVVVTSLDGCMDEDALTLFLERADEIYVPNIFSPNGDGINDLLLINAGDEIREISLFVIFDRWGNEVFSAEHFPADDPVYAWDGTMRDKPLNSAVFAYKLIAEFKDGRSEVRYGDVTFMK